MVATCSYLVATRVVGIKELKNHLSEYVRIAAQGEVVLVTDRDRVVAELREPHHPGVTAHGMLLADLVQQGVVRPALFADAGPPPRMPIAATEVLLAELAADRSDR